MENPDNPFFPSTLPGINAESIEVHDELVIDDPSAASTARSIPEQRSA